MPETPARSRLVLPVILISALVISLGISGTAIALPPISRELGSDPAGLQWVVNGFNATFAAFTLVWGVVSDRIGYRLSFILGLVLVIGGSIMSASVSDILLLDIARLITGAGAAALITSASSILSSAYEGAARGRAFAFFGTTIGIGLSFGPTISGLIIGAIGWRGIFVFVALLASLSLAGSWALPRARVQRGPGQKLVDFSSLRNPGFLALVLVPTAGAFGFVTILTYLPTALSAVYGMDAASAGLFLLPLTLPVLIGPLLAVQLIRRFASVGPMTVMYLALACLVVGDLGLLVLSPGVAAAWLIAPMALVGFGFGLPIGLVDGEALSRVPAANTGTAAGVLDFVRQGSEAIAVGAFAALLSFGIAQTLSGPAAATTAAGIPGHAGTYASVFHWLVLGMAVLVIALSIAIVALQRASQRTRTLTATPPVFTEADGPRPAA